MMGRLYDQMKMDLELKNYSPETVSCYLRWMVQFARQYGRSPIEMGDQEIRKYLHHLIKEKDVSRSSINQAYSAMKFFYATTLERGWNDIRISRIKKSKKLPIELSMEEVKALLGCIENLKHRAILTTIYSGGLRVGEATRLKVAHLDSKRMTIRVEGGKGSKDRYTLLGRHTLALLRYYWRVYRPEEWLFPGAKPGEPISPASVRMVFKGTLQKARIGKKATVHTLRHSFAAHLLESGTDLYYIQHFLGHTTAKTTAIYLHITGKDLARLRSPIDLFDEQPGH